MIPSGLYCHDSELTKFCPMFHEDEGGTICNKFNVELEDSGEGKYGTHYKKCKECLDD